MLQEMLLGTTRMSCIVEAKHAFADWASMHEELCEKGCYAAASRVTAWISS